MANRVPIFRSLDSQRSRKVFTYRTTFENLVICTGLLVGLYFLVILSENQHLKFLTFRQLELLIPVFIVWSCLAFFVASRTDEDDLRFIFILNLATISIVIVSQICIKTGFNSVEEFTYAYFLPILLLQLIGLIVKFQFGLRSLTGNF
jgi:ABC-type polysaccharide transport system permease subunit